MFAARVFFFASVFNVRTSDAVEYKRRMFLAGSYYIEKVGVGRDPTAVENK
jgi:hypothetical protein